ncbi:MAG: hypothetical protein PHU23_17585, partial [Dehalococcoidales bacterium]|nr:hypothetical protein [Dehalococcoidales bacterium]
MSLLLTGVSSQLVADVFDHAAQENENPEIAAYLANDPGKTKVMFRKLFEALPDVKQAAVGKRMTERAKKLIEKKPDPRQHIKDEKARRKLLAQPKGPVISQIAGTLYAVPAQLVWTLEQIIQQHSANPAPSTNPIGHRQQNQSGTCPPSGAWGGVGLFTLLGLIKTVDSAERIEHIASLFFNEMISGLSEEELTESLAEMAASEEAEQITPFGISFRDACIRVALEIDRRIEAYQVNLWNDLAEQYRKDVVELVKNPLQFVEEASPVRSEGVAHRISKHFPEQIREKLGTADIFATQVISALARLAEDSIGNMLRGLAIKLQVKARDNEVLSVEERRRIIEAHSEQINGIRCFWPIEHVHFRSTEVFKGEDRFELDVDNCGVEITPRPNGILEQLIEILGTYKIIIPPEVWGRDRGQEEEKSSVIRGIVSVFEGLLAQAINAIQVRPAQRIISLDSLEIPEMDELGEKPFKLIKMAQAQLPVPKFFVILTDGSGRLQINDELHLHFQALSKPAIARSAHKDEGGKHPFSGIFISITDIDRVAEEGTDFYVISEEEYEDYVFEHDFAVNNLQLAYMGIVKCAGAKGGKAEKYLLQNNITDFDPNRMNLIVMEQIDIEVFGMFITSSQSNQNEVEIHYQLRPENVDSQNIDDDSSFSRLYETRRASEGTAGVVIYNRETNQLGPNKLDPRVQEVLIQFGVLANKIEAMFGLQQIEVCADRQGNVFVLQSRTVNLGDPDDAPRFPVYKTLATGLRAIGYGYYRNLPILVIDELDKVYPELYGCLDNEINRKAREKYRQELLDLQAQHPQYILVIKDAGGVDKYDPIRDQLFKDYDFLNQLANTAQVVIRGKFQLTLRHEDWDKIEAGGVTVITLNDPQHRHDQFMDNFQYLPVETDMNWRRKREQDDVMYIENGLAMQLPRQVCTGDCLSVLSNTDGCFVWQETQSKEQQGGSIIQKLPAIGAFGALGQIMSAGFQNNSPPFDFSSLVPHPSPLASL